MYLLALRYNEEPSGGGRFDGYEIHEERLGSRLLTIVTDGRYSSLEKRADRYRVSDTIDPSSAGPGRILRSEVVVSGRFDTIEIATFAMGCPVVYYVIEADGSFYAATHVRLLREAGVTIAENREVLPELFTYGYVCPPATMYRNVERLVLAERVRFKRGNGRYEIESRQLYRPDRDERHDPPASLESAADATIDALASAIRSLRRVDGEVAVPLSGGIDSSIMWALSHRELGVRESYSVSYPFEDPSRDREIQYAESAAKALGAVHQHYKVTKEQFLQAVVHGISAAEEPIHVQAPLFLLQYASGLPSSARILVSGAGADGRHGKRFLQKIRVASDQWPTRWANARPDLSRRLEQFLGSLGIRTKRLGFVNALNLPTDDPGHIAWMFDLSGDKGWVRDHFGIEPPGDAPGRAGLIHRLREYDPYDLVSFMDLYANVSVFQGIWAKMAETQGRGLFCPFLSIPAMDAAYSVPWAEKLVDLKGILRVVCHRLGLPEFIVSRAKSGLGISSTFWAARGGALEPLVPLAKGVFDIEVIRRVQRRPDNRKAAILWCILNYSIWKRLLIDEEPLETLVEEIDLTSLDSTRRPAQWKRA